MKRIRPLLGTAMLAVITFCNSSRATTFTDTFDGPDLGAGWVTDRYAPQRAEVDGGKLILGVNNTGASANRPPAYQSPFYDTQGLQHAVDYTGSTWNSSAELTIDSSFASGNNLRRSGYWTSTGTSGTEVGAQYFILDVSRFDPLDPYNNAASGIDSRWRAWDSDIGWVPLAMPVTAGTHELDFLFTGSAVEYYIDDTLVYTDTSLNPLASHVRSVYAEVFNFGDSGGSGDFAGPGGYSVSFDNVYVGEPHNAPDGGSTALLAGLGVGALALVRRRKTS